MIWRSLFASRGSGRSLAGAALGARGYPGALSAPRRGRAYPAPYGRPIPRDADPGTTTMICRLICVGPRPAPLPRLPGWLSRAVRRPAVLSGAASRAIVRVPPPGYQQVPPARIYQQVPRRPRMGGLQPAGRQRPARKSYGGGAGLLRNQARPFPQQPYPQPLPGPPPIEQYQQGAPRRGAARPAPPPRRSAAEGHRLCTSEHGGDAAARGNQPEEGKFELPPQFKRAESCNSPSAEPAGHDRDRYLPTRHLYSRARKTGRADALRPSAVGPRKASPWAGRRKTRQTRMKEWPGLVSAGPR